MIVVDVNILSFYVIEGERTREVRALKQMDAEWMVPPFWAIEFQSILWKYTQFGGMTTGTALDLLDKAYAVFSINEVAPAPDIVLRDALNWEISVYDAQYVSLARQYGVRCVTEDGPVRKRCPDVAVSMRDFLKGPTTGNLLREPRAAYRVSKRGAAAKSSPARTSSR